MTVHELQQLFYLERLIAHEQQRLDSLQSAVDVHSPVLTNMPKAPGAHDKLGEIVPEIVDQKAQIEKTLREYKATKEKLLRYINGVPNTRIRLIMILRYVDQKSWQDVADEIGGKETEYSVKKTVYRYLGESI